MHAGHMKKGARNTMTTEKVPIAQAAAEIGCTPQTIREKMYSGEWDLGAYYKKKNSCQKARYYIHRSKLDKFLGKGGKA